jgi:cytochrome c oxidase assembly protein subunit 15
MPTGPVTHTKAWIEMVHRYLATGVGVLILTLAAGTWLLRRREALPVHPWWPTATLVWVCLQGAFGALTVTMKLFPAIVTLHLLGGMVLLALLVRQAVSLPPGAGRARRPFACPSGRFALLVATARRLCGCRSRSAAGSAPTTRCWPASSSPPARAAGGRRWTSAGLRAVAPRWASPAPASTSPSPRSPPSTTCTGWAPTSCSAAGGAGLAAAPGAATPGTAGRPAGLWQLASGLSNVVLGWPLVAALAHTGGAAALVVVLTWALCESRPAGARARRFPSTRRCRGAKGCHRDPLRPVLCADQAARGAADRLLRRDRHGAGRARRAVAGDDLRIAAFAAFGIWLVAGAAAAFNCLIEKGIDAKMKRTVWRPTAKRRAVGHRRRCCSRPCCARWARRCCTSPSTR